MYLDCIAIINSTADFPYSQSPAPPDTLAMFVQLVFMLLAFVVVAFLAYYATRWLAGAQQHKQKNGNVELMESVFLNQYSKVQLIRVGRRYMLLGSTKEHITLLTQVDSEDLVFKDDASAAAPMGFESIINRMMRKDKG